MVRYIVSNDMSLSFISAYVLLTCHLCVDELEDGVARNPLQTIKGFEEVSSHDEDRRDVELAKKASPMHAPAYGDSDNLF